MQNHAKRDGAKNAMADSLKALMTMKPINKISVREITEDCGYNRQSFYYHFQDIYDLLEWIIDEEIVSTMKGNDNFLSWQDAAIYLLTYIRNNESLTLCILNSVNRDSIKRYFYKDASDICTSFLIEKAKGINISSDDFKYITHFYSISFAALLEDWVLSGMKKSPEQVIAILDQIVSGTAIQALERLSDSKGPSVRD